MRWILALVAILGPLPALAADVADYAGVANQRDVWARDMALAGYKEDLLHCMATVVLPASPIEADAAAQNLVQSPSEDALQAFEKQRDAFVAAYRKQKGKHPYEVANMICDHGYN